MHELLSGAGVADTATPRPGPHPVRGPRADDVQEHPPAGDHSLDQIGVLSGVQPKLAVGEVGDRHEQEADRVADAVMRMPAPGTRAAPGGGDEGGTKNETKVESGRASLQGPGQPLPDAERAFFEQRMGHDFSRVRVHHDARAAQSARTIDALAYTAGRDVVFGEGQYAPGTTVGRRLLAHELAHVVQQSRAEGTAGSAGTVQRKPDVPRASRLPPQPTKDDARAEYFSVGANVVPFHYFLGYDIQWYVAMPVVTSNRPFIEGFDLVFYGAQDQRKELSSMQLAEAAADVLAQGVGLPQGGQELAQYIAKEIDEGGGKDAAVLMVGVPFSLARQQFLAPAFDAYWADVQKEYPGTSVWGRMIAGGDFGAGKGAAEGAEGKAPGAKGAEQAKEERPAWVDQRKKEITALLDEARKQTPRPKDLPDRVVLWFNDRDNSWYFNVWVHLDTQGKEKRVYPVRLDQGETAEDLLARLRDATQQALQRAEDREKQELAKQAPAWAIKLERELRRRLAALRAKEKDARDLPDGMVLVPEPEVQIQIWVERGDGPGVQRNTGSVPLKPDTTVDELVPYVRHMTAVLREYEQVPPAPESTEADLDPQNLAPAAFPAEIIPADLRGDNITVTGANNEFVMSLNFEAVYGGAGNMTDLYIASKLHQQYIHYYWEVHPVPTGLPLPEGQKEEPKSWHRRWQWLYDTYNPPPDKEGKPQRRTVATPTDPATKTNGSDLRSRVRMPPVAGDYLLRCVTAHAPIGESKLKRRSSEAYYPLRVRPIEEVAKGAASLRTGAAAFMEGELKGIEEQLAPGQDLDPSMKEMLRATKTIKTADLARLQKKETQTLSENTAEEIAFATETLAKTKRLRQRLPGVLAQAKEQGVRPSELLKDSEELLALWWYLIHERKTPESYEKELEEKIKQLQGVQKRAAEFSSELKASSRYQYGPEAAFVSEVTGQVYPLVLMIGEAPDAVKAAQNAMKGTAADEGVSYSVIDVTSKQTQKVYYGHSANSGPAGHREAIDDAFKHFGEDATYGEGLIAVRIPAGAAGAKDENHPGTEIKTYRSKEGILQKVLFALGIIAAVAGVAALVATGVGAPAAAGLLGAIAATAGAVTALHNIGERQRRHTLEFDAELVLDIISIVGVVPAVAGARGAMSAGRVVVVGKRFLEIYAVTEVGATVILVPTKLYQDIDKIEKDPDLTREQKLKMIAQAKLGAAQAALMLLGSAAASRAGAQHQRGGGFVDEHSSGLRQQIELLELEGFGQYKSLEEGGWIDANGKWTDKALEFVGAKAPAAETAEPRRLPGGEETPPAKQPAEKVELPEARKVEEPVEAPKPKEEPEAPKPKEEPETPPKEPVEAPSTEAPAETPAQQKSAKEAARDEVRKQLAELEHKKLVADAQVEKLGDEISELNRKLLELKEQILKQPRGSKDRAEALERFKALKEQIAGLQEEQRGYVDDRIKYTQQHEALQEALKLERPGLRQATMDAIQAAAKKTPDGKFIDPNTGKVIEGEFVYGHKYGKEHRRLALEAVQKKMTQAEFNDWVNSHPEWFQIESPESNLSHKYEKPGLD